MNPLTETMAALATAPGSSALAVLRVSGEDSLDVVAKVFRGRRLLADLDTFQGASGTIECRGEVLDEVVVWVYRAPRTYTGENLVEISCHGGPVSARSVLEALWFAGARPAAPGEFTRRAFVNGRIDLTQAEAVASLISARGRRAQSQALAQLDGGLSRRIQQIAQPVRTVLARLTAYLDFEEDVPEPPDIAGLLTTLEGAAKRLRPLVDSYAPSKRVREGLTVALVGRPNVGKSSLMNAILGADRALVHDAPGTTRDAIDALVEWDGVPIRLWDTAGVRDQAGPVEAAGIARAKAAWSQADLVYWVVDGSREPTREDEAVRAMVPPETPVTVVINKRDLAGKDQEWKGWVKNHSPRNVERVSALTGEGIDSLIESSRTFLQTTSLKALDAEDIWVTNERHAYLLGEAQEALARGAAVIAARTQPVELAAADLTRCLDSLGMAVGEVAGPELLDEIFSTFCIGK